MVRMCEGKKGKGERGEKKGRRHEQGRREHVKIRRKHERKDGIRGKSRKFKRGNSFRGTQTQD